MLKSKYLKAVYSLCMVIFFIAYTPFVSDNKTIICYLSMLALVLFILIYYIYRHSIDFSSYIIFGFLYLFICAFQTFIINRNIFDSFFYYILICSLLPLVTLIPLNNNDNTNLLSLDKFIKSLIVILVFIFNILSIKTILISGQKEGIFGNRNILGGINLVSFIILISNSLLNHNRVIKIFYIILSIFSLFVCFVTTCRSALLGIFIFVILLIIEFCLKYKVFIKKKKKYFILGIIIAMLVVFFLRNSILDYFLKGAQNADNILSVALSDRYEVWTNAFPNIMKNHWIFGNGVRTFNTGIIRDLNYLCEDIRGFYVRFCHCWPLDIVYSGGLFGLVFFIIFVIQLVIYLKRKNFNLSKLSTRLSFYAIVALLFSGLFDNYAIWDLSYINLLFFIELGKIVGSKYEKE